MNHPSTTTDTLDQADEEILAPDVSDEALEAASSIPLPTATTLASPWPTVVCC